MSLKRIGNPLITLTNSGLRACAIEAADNCPSEVNVRRNQFTLWLGLIVWLFVMYFLLTIAGTKLSTSRASSTYLRRTWTFCVADLNQISIWLWSSWCSKIIHTLYIWFEINVAQQNNVQSFRYSIWHNSHAEINLGSHIAWQFCLCTL